MSASPSLPENNLLSILRLRSNKMKRQSGYKHGHNHAKYAQKYRQVDILASLNSQVKQAR
jgi:hypothetical protein